MTDPDSARQPLRLLVIIAQLRPTGLVRQLLESLSVLAVEHPVEPVVFCVGRRGQDAAALERALVDGGLKHELFWETGPFDPRPLRQIRERVARLHPGAIQTHGYKPAAYALDLRRRFGIPWLAFYHGRTTTDWKVRLYHRFERWAMGRADMVVAVAEGVEDHLRRSDRSRVRVVPNAVLPVAPVAGDRPSVRSSWGLDEASTVVGFVGRLSHEKGPDLFVDALALLHRERPDLVGLVVGDGPMRPEVERRARDLGIEDRVVFAGHRDAIAEAYLCMDALALSSRSEVFPNVLLEAVDSRLAVAATPVGGVPAVARHLASVAVSDAVTPAAIAGAIGRALACDEATRRKAREQLHFHYSQSRRVRAMLEVYEDLGSIR